MAELAPPAGQLLEFVERDDSPREQCGVFGIRDRANLQLLDHAFIGLQQLQHRGEDQAGLDVVADSTPGGALIRGSGMVIEVFGGDGAELSNFPQDAFAANGHVRYGTDRSILGHEDEGAQPRKPSSRFSLAHNGQFTNAQALAEKYNISEHTTDSDLVAVILDKLTVKMYGGDVKEALLHLLPELEGSFCLSILTEKGDLLAARDLHGNKPYQLGSTETGGKIVASEVKAITHIPGAIWDREIKAGELVAITDDGVESIQWAKSSLAICLFEYFYLSNKENIINGRVVGEVRRELGRLLWQEYAEAFESEFAEGEFAAQTDDVIDFAFKALVKQFHDPEVEEPEILVMPVPNSGIQAAQGFAEASGYRLDKDVLTRNDAIPYKRSFIQSSQANMVTAAFEKLILHGEKATGKNLRIIEDTVVRGTTGGVNMKKIRGANPARMELLAASPMIVDTCPLGVAIGTKDELIANRHNGDLKAMAEELGVDRLFYLSLQAIVNLLGNTVCMKCVGGPGPSPFVKQHSADEGKAPVHRASLPLFVAGQA